MEFSEDLWYLLILIPVVFGAGWFARSFDLKEKKNDSADETQTLYKGLDLLLSNKEDQAIDSFINLTKIDPGTVELHYSLGSLFRKRGDYAKAIRIHNYLYNRVDLPKKERARALFELGNDYLKAGIWDKAEESFRKVADSDNPNKIDAIRQLIYIYESEKDWLKAVDETHILESRVSDTSPSRVSHLFCEASEQALREKNAEAAKKYLENAMAADPKNKRALIMLGDTLKAKGDLDTAVTTWRKVGQISPQYETLVVSRIANTLLEAGKKDDAVRYLKSVAETASNSDELDAAIEIISKILGAPQALEILKRHLKSQNSLIIFLRFVELERQANPTDESLNDLEKLLKQQVDKTARYKCSKCGFVTRKFQWQCPGCRNWDSFPTTRSEVAGRKY